MSLTDNDQASGTGASLNEQGQQRADEEGADGLAGQQASVYGGSLYHGALQGAGNQVECYNTNVDQSLEVDGTVKTCDGQQTASFDPGCKTVTECLQQDTTTRTWSETCEAEVPLTTKTCTTKTPTLDCDGARLKQQFSCSKKLSVAVTAKVVAAPCTGSPGKLALPSGSGGHIFVTLSCTAQPGVYTASLSDDWTRTHCSGSGQVTAGAAAPVEVWCQPVHPDFQRRVANKISCDGPNCTLTSAFWIQGYSHPYIHSQSSLNFIGSSTSIAYTYTDTWTDGCTSYK